MGRPSRYTDKLALAICRRIASGDTLTAICKDSGMPNKSTVLRWAISNQDFCDHYAQARAIRADLRFEDILELAATAKPTDVQCIKLQVDTLKWVLSREFPKKYGEKQALEVTGESGGPIQIVYDKSFDGL